MTAPYFDAAGETRGFLESEGRGGVLPPEACAEALLRVLDEPDPNFSGQVLTVHPAGRATRGTLVPVDPGGALAHLGTWRAAESTQVAAALEKTLAGIASGEVPAWSSVPRDPLSSW